jgi:hypothetical protein
MISLSYVPFEAICALAKLTCFLKLNVRSLSSSIFVAGAEGKSRRFAARLKCAVKQNSGLTLVAAVPKEKLVIPLDKPAF